MPSIESQVLSPDKVISVLGIDNPTLQKYTSRHGKLLSDYASGNSDALGYTATDISLLESIDTWDKEGNSPEKIDTLLMQKLEAMLENVGEELNDDELEILSVFAEIETDLDPVEGTAPLELPEEAEDFMITALTENSNRNREKLNDLQATVGSQQDIIKALSSELAEIKAGQSKPSGVRRMANISIVLNLVTLLLVAMAFALIWMLVN